MSDDAGARTGTQLGPYAIGELLGRGGMGEVYLAHDDRRTRDVALKLLHPSVAEDPDFRERFTRESQTVARLADPHVIPIHDFGDIEGVLFLDMRLVEGRNLAEVLHEGPLPPARAVEVIEQIAGALDAAHAQGLIHRDVKPSNIEITSGGFPYLLDFGLAVTDSQSRMTSAGVFIGSQAYAAPERFDGSPATVSADVYSLACVLYEALTGRPPYRASSLTGMLGQHLNAPIPRPSEEVDIDPAMDRVIARGMAKAPDDRYTSCGELAVAARAALDGEFTEPEAGTGSETGVGASAGAGAAAGTVVLTKAGDATPAPDADKTIVGGGVRLTKAGDDDATAIRPADQTVISAAGSSDATVISGPAASDATVISGPAAAAGPGVGSWTGTPYPGQQHPSGQFPAQYPPGQLPPPQQYPPQYGGYPPAPPKRNLVPILAGAAVVLLVVVGVLGYLMLSGGKDRDTTRTAAGDSADPTVTIGSTVTATPTTEVPLTPGQALSARVDADRPIVLSQLNNRWVAQLSTKWPGLVADGRTWDDGAILGEVNALQQRFGTVRLLWTTQWPVFTLQNVWVTVYGNPFPGPDAAIAWCRQQGFDGDHCLAKFISTTAGTTGTTKTY